MNSYLNSICQETVPIIRFDNLSNVSFIQHGFTTRLGGVSKGIFASMNLSFSRGDDKEAVMKNYEIIAENEKLDINTFTASAQTHTTNIRIVSKSDCGKGILKDRDYDNVDGLMTDDPGIVLFTYYADCVPLYFVDQKKKVIALSHSGWRGTVQKMGQVTIETIMKKYGSDPKDILVAIGPSICQKCYEVSKEVIDEFQKVFKQDECKQFIERKTDEKYQLDLWKVNEIILENAGIPKSNIENRRICTCCNKELLFSHRGLHGKRGNLAAFMTIKNQ